MKFALDIYRSWRMMTPDLFQPLSGRNITTAKISYSVREISVQNAEHIHNPTGTCPLDCNGPTTFQSCKILCDSGIYFTQTGFPGWYFIFSLIMWQCTRITTSLFYLFYLHFFFKEYNIYFFQSTCQINSQHNQHHRFS